MNDDDKLDLDEMQQAYRDQRAPQSLTRRIVAAAADSRPSQRTPWLPALGGVAAASVLGLFVFLQQTAVTPTNPAFSLSRLSAEISRAERAVTRELSSTKARAPSLGSIPSVRIAPASPTLRAPAKETHTPEPQNAYFSV